MKNLASVAERAKRRREEAQRIANTQREENNMSFGSLRPLITLFFTSMGRKVLAAARKAVVRVAQESISNPQWTDEERRERAIAIVKEEIGTQFPGASFLINFAIEYAVGVLRSRLK